MLLTITYEGKNTQDLGYLLYKKPGKLQEFSLNFGKAYVFYPEASDERTTAALLLDMDPLDLAKGKRGTSGKGLFDYVNDRPYAASSFLATAMKRVFGTAMTGRCDGRPELAGSRIRLTAAVYGLPVRGSKAFLREAFEPLGYDVSFVTKPLDGRFPEWGESGHVDLEVSGRARLSDLLNQLYVLIPASDGRRHYFVGEDEIEKLLEHGGGWLEDHPARDEIVYRYFSRTKSYARKALEAMGGRRAGRDYGGADGTRRVPLDELRREAVKAAVLSSGASSVIDLGCGEGKLIETLVHEKRLARIAGMDVSADALAKAERRLGTGNAEPGGRGGPTLMQGSLLYSDGRLKGYDAACLTEVIEHVDPERIGILEGNLFGHAAPRTVVVTTPNADYNARYGLEGKELRHGDHRFEWTEEEFREWADHICSVYGYSAEISGIGEPDPEHGQPTEMGVFTKCRKA